MMMKTYDEMDEIIFFKFTVFNKHSQSINFKTYSRVETLSCFNLL